VTKWREHLRAVALIINILLVVFLIGSKGWWMSMGLGIPLIVAPLLSVIALSVRPSGWRKSPDQRVLQCSFCNKWQDKVGELIAGPGVLICDECVQVCNDILADARRFQSSGPRREVPTTWPEAIQCALCHVALRAEQSVVIAGNRGILCADCVKAVVTARTS
jgi:hypothetical protein